jgi:hypothetical protein
MPIFVAQSDFRDNLFYVLFILEGHMDFAMTQ